MDVLAYIIVDAGGSAKSMVDHLIVLAGSVRTITTYDSRQHEPEFRGLLLRLLYLAACCSHRGDDVCYSKWNAR